MLGSFSMSHLMCGAAGGAGADLELAEQLQERSGRAEAACLVSCVPALRTGHLSPTLSPKCHSQSLNN